MLLPKFLSRKISPEKSLDFWSQKSVLRPALMKISGYSNHVHSNVDGLPVLPADFLSPRRHRFVHPWSVRWQPIRFERMATVLIQSPCIRPVIEHVHPPGDVNQSIRGLPYLRALLPTSCVQGADIMMIIDRNEGANLWRRQL